MNRRIYLHILLSITLHCVILMPFFNDARSSIKSEKILDPFFLVNIEEPLTKHKYTAPAKKIKLEKKTQQIKNIKKTHKKQRPQGIREDTIHLNSHKLKYSDYTRQIKKRIETKWEYPREAQEKGITGTVRLTFTIDKNGEIVSIKLHDNDPDYLLYNSTVLAISQAAPFGPIPERLRLDRLHIKALFKYSD